MSPRPPPKKHQVKAAQPAWRPGDARQVVSQANQANDGPAQELTIRIAGSATIEVPHTLGRIPKSAWVTVGADKVTVRGASTTTITVANSDPGPQSATIALS